MKKLIVTLTLLSALVTAVFGQAGPGGSGLIDVQRYSSQFVNSRGYVQSKYLDAATDEDYDRIAALGGDQTDIDTPFEIAALSLATGVIDIRPVEADAILPKNNLKLSYTKLGAVAYQDALLARFLGNTAEAGIHEGELKFALDKGGISRAEVESFYRQNIGAYVAEIVDTRARERNYTNATVLADIKKVATDFFTSPSQSTYTALLTAYRRYAGEGAIVLGHTVSDFSEAISRSLTVGETNPAQVTR